MAKPIGRVWIMENLLSGYVVFGNYALKFGANLTNADSKGSIFLYPSKKQVAEEEETMQHAKETQKLAETQISA